MMILNQLGSYYILLARSFKVPEKKRVYFRRVIDEINFIGIGSLGITIIISLFMGIVILIQSAYGFQSPWIPIYAEGFACREGIILEFAPTILSLILAGKVGSSIASEIGTMRVRDQIDAIEIMGINSAGYLIAPKIIATVLVNPFLVMISMFLGIFGGWAAAIITGSVTSHDFIYGIQYEFVPWTVSFALIKSVVFAFIISSVSAFHGYSTRGGALEVGRASTKAVVYSNIIILLFNVILTKLLLTT